MNKDLKNIINQFSDDENTLNKILVSIFINSNSLKVKNNKLIKDLILNKESPLYHHIVFATYKFSFDELIESFELAIPSKEIVVNGAVYTPNYIKSFIVEACSFTEMSFSTLPTAVKLLPSFDTSNITAVGRKIQSR